MTYQKAPKADLDTLKELTKTQKEIDAMTDEELKQLNAKVEAFASEEVRRMRWFLMDFYEPLNYAYRRYKELRKDAKEKHPFWRSKGAFELVLLELPYPVTKFTQGFHIFVGDTGKHLLSLEIFFDKEGRIKTSTWYRVYIKTKIRTPEEQAAYDEEIRLKVEEDNKKQFLRNCDRFGIKASEYGTEVPSESDDGVYKLVGCYPRNKKMPLKLQFTHNTDESKNAIYSAKIEFYTRLKKLAKQKSKGDR